MDNQILKFYKAEIKGINKDEFTLEAVVSTKKTDRDGDIVLPEAFGKNLKHYKEHPVLLSSHDYRDLRKQIGEAVNVKVTDSGLEAKFKYYVGLGNPEADWAWVLAQQGIASYSIGFLGTKFEMIEDKDEEGNIRTSGRKFTEVELLEVSQVVVPSNRQSLQMGIEQAELCELAIKSLDKGDIKEISVEKPPVAKTADAVAPEQGDVSRGTKKDAEDKPHYTDLLLDGGQQTKADLGKQEVDVKAVSEAVKEVLLTYFKGV